MPTTQRRSAQQWQALVEQWQTSGQNASEFCREQNIGYASFCQWRKRLQQDTSSPSTDGTPFIDLSSLANEERSWQIVLSLGGGVELRLSQQ